MQTDNHKTFRRTISIENVQLKRYGNTKLLKSFSCQIELAFGKAMLSKTIYEKDGC